MAIERLNPDGIHLPPGYSQVTVVSATRFAHLAGQCPLDASGRLVGPGDVLAQTDQVVANALRGLASVDATPADVVRTVIYVVSPDKAPLSAVWERLLSSPLAEAFTTASTLLGVTALGFTGQLVEIDLTAALD